MIRMKAMHISLFGLMLFMLMPAAYATTYVGSCGVLGTAGETYVLTADLHPMLENSSCINVTANDVTIDCAGHEMTGNYNNDMGVWGNDTDGLTIHHCNISNYTYGVYLSDSDDVVIRDSSVHSSGAGIYMDPATNAQIYNNRFWEIFNSEPGAIYLDNIDGFVIHDNVMSDSVTYNSYIWTYESSNGQIYGNDMDYPNYGIYCDYGDNIAIYDNDVDFSQQADIYLGYMTNSEVYNNRINYGSGGVELYYTTDSDVYGNTVIGSGNGVYVGEECYRNDVYENEISSMGTGVGLASSYDTRVYGNTISDAYEYGIYMSSASNTEVYENTLADNMEYAIYSESSEDTNIHDNEISGTTHYGVYINSGAGNCYIENNALSSTYVLQPGCYGRVTPCGFFLDRFSCSQQQGCRWSSIILPPHPPLEPFAALPIPIPIGRCIGIATPCSFFDDSFSCGNQARCSWRSEPLKDDYHVYVTGQDGVQINRNVLTNDPEYGIWTSSSPNTVIYNNYVDGGYALRMYDSDFSDVQMNSLLEAEYGAYLEYTDESTFSNNWIYDTTYGIFLSESDTNTLFHNTASQSEYAIYVNSGSGYNLIWDNIFRGTTPAYEETTLDPNEWNNDYDCSEMSIVGGECRGGNYYSDYEGPDADGDGVGEVPYPVPDSGTEDAYPLFIRASPPTQGGGDDTRQSQMSLSHELVCPGNGLTVTVTDTTTGTPLADAEVSVEGIGSEATGADGKAVFGISESGDYKATGSKSGYESKEKVLPVYALCQEEIVPQCGPTAGCPGACEECVQGQCVVSGCVSDDECGEGFVCAGCGCVAREEPPSEEPPEEPADGQTGGEDSGAAPEDEEQPPGGDDGAGNGNGAAPGGSATGGLDESAAPTDGAGQEGSEEQSPQGGSPIVLFGLVLLLLLGIGAAGYYFLAKKGK